MTSTSYKYRATSRVQTLSAVPSDFMTPRPAVPPHLWGLSAFLLLAACSSPSQEGNAASTSSTGGPSSGYASGGEATTNKVTGASSETAGTGTGVSSDTGQQPAPFQVAAEIACAGFAMTPRIAIPGNGQMIGFRFDEYPARFGTTFSDADAANVFDNDMWCHVIQPVCTADECRCPLNDCESWIDDDGELRIYIATRGIDDIVFYGTAESPANTPGAPMTPSLEHDVGDICPELPTVWTIDPEEVYPGVSMSIVCMHHSEDVAEVMFVRIP